MVSFNLENRRKQIEERLAPAIKKAFQNEFKNKVLVNAETDEMPTPFELFKASRSDLPPDILKKHEQKLSEYEEKYLKILVLCEPKTDPIISKMPSVLKEAQEIKEELRDRYNTLVQNISTGYGDEYIEALESHFKGMAKKLSAPEIKIPWRS